jgi:hypothetical protein
VTVDRLRIGEHVPGVAGPLAVKSIERLPGVHRVYNMTVESEHVYHVSTLGALVHNECPVYDVLPESYEPPVPENPLGEPAVQPPADGGEYGVAPATTNPVQGLPRVGSALKTDPYHAFPDIVDNFASGATSTTLRSGATLHQVEGSLNGVAGRFEWIIDNGQVTHRMFVPGGTLNGVPIKP